MFLSSKRDSEGMGLSSVAAAAEKNGGAAKFETAGGLFQASVYIRLQ